MAIDITIIHVNKQMISIVVQLVLHGKVCSIFPGFSYDKLKGHTKYKLAI